MLPIAADYPFLDVLWTMILFFAWLAWIWVVVTVLADVFRRHDIGGWHKAAWTVFVIVVPFLGVLAYLIANSEGMRDRSIEWHRRQQGQVDDYIRHVAGGPAGEIAQAKQLLDEGAIDRVEFEAIKSRAMGRAAT